MTVVLPAGMIDRILSLALVLLVLAPVVRADDAHPEKEVDDYLALPSKLPAAAKRSPPRSDAEVDALVAAIPRQPLAAGALDVGAIASALGSGFGFMRSALARSAPALETTATKDHGDYVERTVALRDPFVGTIRGILLVPKTKSGTKAPAILALHGHGDSAEKYRDLHHAAAYARHGIAVLMITSRAMNIDADEHRVARALLAADETLMGVRVYEALAALAALRAVPEVDGERVGLIGHSGGSSTGNLVVRLDPKLKAYVSDHAVSWATDEDEPYHCESVPGLYPIHHLIDDFGTCSMPVETVPYGFGREKVLEIDELEMGALVSFFDHELGAKPFSVPGGDGPTYPYTCTFHWFRGDDGAVIGLDVIRDAQNLGLRVFVAKTLPEKADGSPDAAVQAFVKVAPKSEWEPFATARPSGATAKPWLARGAGFIAGHVDAVSFDLSVTVQSSGTPALQLGELGEGVTKLSAIDYGSALTEGTITIGGVTRHVKALGPASIHFGQQLPDYAYLATVPDPKDPSAAQILLSATNATNFGAKSAGGLGSIYAYVKTADGRGRTFFVPLGEVKKGEIPLGVGKTLALSDFTGVPHELLGEKAATGVATATLTERKLIDTTDVVSFFKALFGAGPVKKVTKFTVVADLRGGYVPLLDGEKTPPAPPPSKTRGLDGALGFEH
jgi:hypothetical protein